MKSAKVRRLGPQRTVLHEFLETRKELAAGKVRGFVSRFLPVSRPDLRHGLSVVRDDHECFRSFADKMAGAGVQVADGNGDGVHEICVSRVTQIL